MAKKLIIDLDAFRRDKNIEAKCTYFYHPNNDGTKALREMATYAVICRQCELAGCVQSCPKEALEKQPNGVLQRYNLRCIACKCCAVACPFGTILTELIPFYTSQCDYCLGRTPDMDTPDCVKTCSKKEALKFEEIQENPESGIYFIGEHLAARAANFIKKLEKELMKELE
jgi:Fe-S-cluster-containing dehydrogenase component